MKICSFKPPYLGKCALFFNYQKLSSDLKWQKTRLKGKEALSFKKKLLQEARRENHFSSVLERRRTTTVSDVMERQRGSEGPHARPTSLVLRPAPFDAEPSGCSACSWQPGQPCSAKLGNVPTQQFILLPVPAATVLAPLTSLGSLFPNLYLYTIRFFCVWICFWGKVHT